MKVKTVWVMLVPAALALATACSSQPTLPEFDYNAVTVQETEAGLQRAQTWETFTRDKKLKAAEVFKLKKDEYQLAGDREKPVQLTLLAGAQANYLETQQDHMEAKRQLDNAKRVYIRKQILIARPWLAESPPPSLPPLKQTILEALADPGTPTPFPQQPGPLNEFGDR